MQVLNPKKNKLIPKKEIKDVLEKLARGSFTESKTLISKKYSRRFY